jgi:hypothetical protein
MAVAFIVYESNVVAGVIVDVRKSDSHQLEAEVTMNTIETGEKISDHVILRPRRLSVMFEQVNTNEGLARATEVWSQFRSLWLNRGANPLNPAIPQLLEVYTEHEIYENMVIARVNALHVAPFKGALQFTVEFVQINSVSFEYVAVPESQLPTDSEVTNKKASSEVIKGLLEVLNVDASDLTVSAGNAGLSNSVFSFLK